MAYNQKLATRIREELSSEADLTEKAIGGLGFMLSGHMAVAANSAGDMMIRVAPARGAALIAAGEAAPQQMRGRTMNGWLTLSAEHLTDDAALARWVGEGRDYVRTLPPKRPKR